MTVKEKDYIERIRNNYVNVPTQKSKLEELKSLDQKVKNPAKIFGYCYGIIGCLILGTGMCLAMNIIGNLMPLGIIIGLVGIAMVSTSYPLFKKILKNRKTKFADEIILRSNELLNEHQDV